eukprot:6204888-Pleurochrysis_carterae.AAC.1
MSGAHILGAHMLGAHKMGVHMLGAHILLRAGAEIADAEPEPWSPAVGYSVCFAGLQEPAGRGAGADARGGCGWNACRQQQLSSRRQLRWAV